MKTTPWPMTHQGRRISDRSEPGLVSVIIPTYNRAGMLTEAMDSVWAQTYRPIELIVVDDGSTDGTREAVAQWGRRCAGEARFRLTYIRQERGGQSAARNVGALESRGAYLQFLDSDDYLHPDRFRRVLALAASVPGFELALTGYERVGEDKRPRKRREPLDVTAPDRVERLIRWPLWVASAFYARGFLRKVGFFRSEIRYGEDWEYGLRVAIRSAPERCVLLNEPLGYYRDHSGPRYVGERRTRQEIQRLFAAAEADLEQEGFGTGHLDLLALGLVLWFAKHNDHAYLRQALGVGCSVTLKSKVMALLLLSTLLDGPSVVRRWYQLRRMAEGFIWERSRLTWWE